MGVEVEVSRSSSMAGEANPLADMWDAAGEGDGGRRPEAGAGS